jgi:hypothetical protein
MSINYGQTTVGTAATYITTGKTGASWVQLHAPLGGNSVYVGDASVTASTGLELEKGAVVQVWLAEADKLYAIVGTNTEVLKWMHTGGR